MQMLTGSAGASYRWDQTLFSVNMKYGSGLPNGFANSWFNQPYATANIGISREFQAAPGAKPLTLRFDVVNLFDKIYEIRDGSGIGVFAPQFGARRGFYRGSFAEDLMGNEMLRVAHKKSDYGVNPSR